MIDHLSRPQSENQSKQRQVLGLCRQRTKKAMEHESNSNTNYNWCTRNNLQRLGKGAGRVGNWRMSQDHPNYSIVKIGQNIEKSPGELRKHAVTQISVKDQLTLV